MLEKMILCNPHPQREIFHRTHPRGIFHRVLPFVNAGCSVHWEIQLFFKEGNIEEIDFELTTFMNNIVYLYMTRGRI